MTTVSYRSFTGTAAENYKRHFVPAIATRCPPPCWRPPTCSPAGASSTSPAAPA